MLDEILLLTNGPGELSTWVPPVLTRLRRAVPGARVELFLIRDQFAAGTERLKAQELHLDAVSGRADLLKRSARRKRGGKGLVLMLGGAPRDAVLLGRSTGYPTYVYSFDPKAWHPKLTAFLVDSGRPRQAAIQRGADANRVRVVGNLVVDVLEDAGQTQVPPVDLLLFPSSRPFAVRYLLGFMLAAAEQVAHNHSGLKVGWVKSRLLPDAVVDEALSGKWAKEIGGVSASWKGNKLLSQNGLEVTVLDESLRYGAMRQARAAITIPGTNTLELALAGLPAVVLLPLHKPELLPLEGILHWLFMLPGARGLKQTFVQNLVHRMEHLALPNQWLGEWVFPELRGTFGPDLIAKEVEEILEPERREAIRSKLSRLDAQPGADNLVEYVLGHARM